MENGTVIVGFDEKVFNRYADVEVCGVKFPCGCDAFWAIHDGEDSNLVDKDQACALLTNVSTAQIGAIDKIVNSGIKFSIDKDGRIVVIGE